MAERDRARLARARLRDAAVLAKPQLRCVSADAELDAGAGPALSSLRDLALLDSDLHQLADAGLIDRLERIAGMN